MTDKPRVVVTGMGIVSAIGCDEATFWQNLVSGQTGIERVTSLDPSEYKSQLGAEVDNQVLVDALAARQFRPVDRTVDMALVAAAQALESAGVLSAEEPEPHSTAVIVGSAGGSSLSTEEGYQKFAEMGLRGLRPTTVPRCMINAVSSHVSMKFRLNGPNYVIAAACSAATHAIGVGLRMIRDGYTTRVLCGGADTCFAPVLFGAWDRLGVMSRNPDAEKASRPFDIARDGFVMGEGAGMLLLETLDAATARGARVRGEVAGYGESSDADHITRPSEEGQVRAMADAMASAGIQPQDIDFINAHGTGTKANDECESRSIKSAMKDATQSILVASNKSFFGHALGASGALETIATLLGMEDGRVPPNLNLNDPDPACDLNCAPATATKLACNVAMKNSFGFGGSNAVLILKRA